jgi:hypothetical protein
MVSAAAIETRIARKVMSSPSSTLAFLHCLENCKREANLKTSQQLQAKSAHFRLGHRNLRTSLL